MKLDLNVLRISVLFVSSLELVKLNSRNHRLPSLLMQLINLFTPFSQTLPDVLTILREKLFLQMNQFLIKIHPLYNSLATLSIHLENLWPDDLLNSLRR